MEKKKLDIKTYKFNEFQEKVEEGHENVGFDTYKRHTEYEEDSVDDLGTGDEIDTNDIDTAPDVEEAPDTVEPNNDEIDTGDQDVSVVDVEQKINDLKKITKIMKTQDLKNVYKDINNILAKYPL